MRPEADSVCIICDIDGTLVDPTHRLHYVTGPNPNWPAFFDAIPLDTVHEPIKWLLHEAQARQSGPITHIIFCSGRPNSHRKHTQDQLTACGFHGYPLYMRATGDYRADDIVKSELLDQIIADGYHPKLVFDDRPRVIAMWRKRGLMCLDVGTWAQRAAPSSPKGELHLMVGPAGAGKTTWLRTQSAGGTNIDAPFQPQAIISTDRLRLELCGDMQDQSKNSQVFAAAHALIATRINHGLPAYFDATNLRRKDRLEVAALASGGPVHYHIIDRPLADKLLTRGSRSEDLIRRYHQRMRSCLKDILSADNLPNVTVHDHREPKGARKKD